MTALKWSFSDLVVDPVTGLLSETKISSLLIKLIFAWAFVYEIMRGPVSTELWFVVGTMFIAHEAWSRIASARFIQPAIDKMAGTPTQETTSTSSTSTSSTTSGAPPIVP